MEMKSPTSCRPITSGFDCVESFAFGFAAEPERAPSEAEGTQPVVVSGKPDTCTSIAESSPAQALPDFRALSVMRSSSAVRNRS
jgi:hypothetical protein